MPKVFVTSSIPENGIKILKQEDFSVEINDSGKPTTRHDLILAFSKFDAVITSVSDKVDEEVISEAGSNLKVISNYAVGIDNIEVLFASKKGITVTNTPGVAGEAVAEHAFALMLGCAKNLLEADKFVRQGKYLRFDPNLFVGPQMWGKTIGIIGLGRIGTFVGHIAYGGFKMNIKYYNLERAEDFEMLTEAEFATLDRLLKDSDVVTLHLPLTPNTKHLIGREEFKKMKNTAILINTARGPIIDEEALVWALQEKEIAAAGIDVFEHEPEVASELTKMGNVILTPHTASATVECREEMSRIAAENIVDVFHKKEPYGLVRVD